MKSIVSEKGQVTIPKAIRDTLGIRMGTELEFEALEGKLIATKRESSDPVAKWRGRGRLPRQADVDGYLQKARG